MDEKIMNVADLVDRSDPQGRTYRQINAAKTHRIPIGALVEIVPDEADSRWDGVRLYVVCHHRDCDGTPLYAMAWDRFDTVQHRPGFHNPSWLHGFSEESLREIQRDEEAERVRKPNESL